MSNAPPPPPPVFLSQISKGKGRPDIGSQSQASELATQAAEALLNLSNARGTVDNVTVVVMLFF